MKNNEINHPVPSYKHLSSTFLTTIQGKNPIPMEQFLQFLTVDTKSNRKSFWVERSNEAENLVIIGGLRRSHDAVEEYLDTIEFDNNCVNPFYIWHLMNSDGKAFFAKYYREELDALES